MASIRVSRFAAESGQMPRKCICCGSDATQNVRHTFYYQPAWMVLFYILLPRWVKWSLSSDPVTASVPVCMSHATRLKWPTYVGYLFLAGVLVLVPTMVGASYSENPVLINLCGLLLFLFAVGVWILYVAVALMTPRAVQYTSSTITFGAVSQEFAHSAGASSVSSTRVPSAGIPPHLMPGYRANQGTSGAKLALYIIGGGMAVVLLGCCGLPVLGALLRAARPNFPQQVAQQPQPPNLGLPPTPNFTPPPPTFVQPPTWTPPTSPPPTLPSDVAPGANPTVPPSETPPAPATPPDPTPMEAPLPPLPNFVSPSGGSDSADAVTAADAKPDPEAKPWSTTGGFVIAHLRGGKATIYPAGTKPATQTTPLSVGSNVWSLQGGAWRCGIVEQVLGAEMVRIRDATFKAKHDLIPLQNVRVTAGAEGLASTPEVGSSASSDEAAASDSESSSHSAAASGPLTEDTARVDAGLRSGEATQFPQGSSPLLPTTKLKRGDTLWTLWGSTWYPSSVVQAQPSGPVKIHYFGYSDTFDEVLPRDRLRLPAGASANKPAKPPAKTVASTATSADKSADDPATTAAEEPAEPAGRNVGVMRTWTDTTGKFKIEAKLLEVVNGKARLEKADGKVISLPLDKLSPADRKFAEGEAE